MTKIVYLYGLYRTFAVQISSVHNHFFMFNLEIGQTLMFVTFMLGFGVIAFGSKYINSVLAAFITATVCWIELAAGKLWAGKTDLHQEFYAALGETGNIVFFLIFALLIVQIIEYYNGFDGITRRWKKIASRGENVLLFNHLLWCVTLTAFGLAVFIDNVTAAVIVTLAVAKLVKQPEELFFFAFFGVIGANAGGTFSPIGEITTTQLWAGGQITFIETFKQLALPSFISIIVPLSAYSLLHKNKSISLQETLVIQDTNKNIKPLHTNIILGTSLFSLLFVVPFCKGYLHLPPALGALAALSIVWLLTEILHWWIGESKKKRSTYEYTAVHVNELLPKMEWETPLFFLGILLAVEALKTGNVLIEIGNSVSLALAWFGAWQQPVITLIVGFVSAVMDNVALVATVQGMYPIDAGSYAPNSPFWFLLSFCAGTGGSMLVVGSAAGVAVRNKLDNEFGGKPYFLDTWFFKNISIWALINYITGFFIYLLSSFF